MVKMSTVFKAMPFTIRSLPKKWRQGLLKDISGTDVIDTTDPVVINMVENGLNYYIPKLTVPTKITAKQMQQWNFPVYVAFADNSTIHNPYKGIEVAKKNLKNATCKLWRNATHSLPMEYPEELKS